MSPIRAENRHRYPPDWPDISRAIKERAGWRCECLGECGRGTHEGRCPNEHGQPAYGTGSRVVLTTAHLNHTPEDCRPEVLRAMCQGCHLHYDRDHHAQTRAATRRQALADAGQQTLPWTPWTVVGKADPRAAALADRHYSRRKVGAPQFMPPGQTLVLLTLDQLAVFGWWRPHPDSGIRAMNGLDGWTCTIFRNESPALSSTLILAAERELLDRHDVGPDGLITYVWDARVRSVNPGACFKHAGWERLGRSADGRKTRLGKAVPA